MRKSTQSMDRKPCWWKKPEGNRNPSCRQQWCCCLVLRYMGYKRRRRCAKKTNSNCICTGSALTKTRKMQNVPQIRLEPVLVVNEFLAVFWDSICQSQWQTDRETRVQWISELTSLSLVAYSLMSSMYFADIDRTGQETMNTLTFLMMGILV